DQAHSKETKIKPATFAELFFFADKLDYIFMFIGAIAAIGAGVVMPLFSIIFGDILDSFYGPDPANEVFIPCVNKNALYFVYLAVTAFFLNATMNTLFTVTSSRQVS
ncbi:unnamed protein product, partial [Discosporangium mesarthrocarpum]